MSDAGIEIRSRIHWGWLAIALGLLGTASLVAATVGPAGLPVSGVITELLGPLAPGDSGLTDTQQTILWELRMPRIALGALVGATLALSGASYQGAFRNPLADPYLLGVAAGAGLGATLAIGFGLGSSLALPIAAFAGAVVAVILSYAMSTSVGERSSATSLILAGVAVAAFLTAAQTYIQQRQTDTLRQVYSWILGRLSTAGWSEVRLVLPYVVISTAVLILSRRALDVLRLGDLEANSLGLPASRIRLIVVAAATLGSAAVVAVSGLIGFVGIIVPHTIRLMIGGGHRSLLPISMIGGAAFLVLADLAARTVIAPAELPIGVITAFLGAPFFALILRRSRPGAA